MSEVVALPKEEWDNLKHEIAIIKEALLGSVDGDKIGIRRQLDRMNSDTNQRLDKLENETRQSLRTMEHELQDSKRRLTALEDGRQWLHRLVGGGLISLALSALFAAIQMWSKR